jgi:hypothetical protein
MVTINRLDWDVQTIGPFGSRKVNLPYPSLDQGSEVSPVDNI